MNKDRVSSVFTEVEAPGKVGIMEEGKGRSNNLLVGVPISLGLLGAARVGCAEDIRSRVT